MRKWLSIHPSLWKLWCLYTLVYGSSARYLNGGYDTPIRISQMIRGMLMGTVVILVGYALLPEDLRFSRALILFGTAWASLSIAATRLLLHVSGLKKYRFSDSIKKRLLVGDADESQRVLSLIMLSGSKTNFIGYVAEKSSSEKENPIHSHYLGHPEELTDLISIYEINKNMYGEGSSADIIGQMLRIGKDEIEINCTTRKLIHHWQQFHS